MNTNQRFVLIQGKRQSGDGALLINSGGTPNIGHTVANAIHAGFRIGQPVRIGQVDGRIVGYNIGHFGLFSGKDYPLLVRTRYGIAKCSLAEVAAA
ncbi:MAG: hypothetical protein LBP86_08895 [Azoarcus sp.]|jgi:hypothetical protein|nr:hypothetical protein [Azoarcus sp.]